MTVRPLFFSFLKHRVGRRGLFVTSQGTRLDCVHMQMSRAQSEWWCRFHVLKQMEKNYVIYTFGKQETNQFLSAHISVQLGYKKFKKTFSMSWTFLILQLKRNVRQLVMFVSLIEFFLKIITALHITSFIYETYLGFPWTCLCFVSCNLTATTHT